MSSDVSSRSRSYLSIREVLDLLVNDFPEITISKIRFLESRGLIHPERTPSGYRKFYEADVKRLRWILMQQREHFLPLKVIKGRLDGTNGGVPTPVAGRLFDDERITPEPHTRSPFTRADDPAARHPSRSAISELNGSNERSGPNAPHPSPVEHAPA